MDIIFCKITHFMDIILQTDVLFFHPDTCFPVKQEILWCRDAARYVSTKRFYYVPTCENAPCVFFRHERNHNRFSQRFRKRSYTIYPSFCLYISSFSSNTFSAARMLLFEGSRYLPTNFFPIGCTTRSSLAMARSRENWFPVRRLYN